MPRKLAEKEKAVRSVKRATKAGRGSTAKKAEPSPFSRSQFSKTVSIVGAGRLGTALGIALAAKGYQVRSIVSPRISDARQAARLIDENTQPLSAAQLHKLDSVHIIIVATPDDAIEAAARNLARALGWNGRGSVALHASGALSSSELDALAAIGFATGSMHPLVSVSDPVQGSRNLARAHYCIEGSADALRVSRALVRAMGGKSFSIRTEDKALYHAAAVMSSGHVVALFDIAIEMLTNCGLTSDTARAALLPLLQSTITNLSNHAPAAALTGTFARADSAIVRKHLAALRRLKSEDATAAYLLMGRRSTRLAKENGVSPAALKKIVQLLKSESRK
jgi:predicted short-subunit dehydrogenase-like oxidoreductase (DUF2520 family)